MEIGISVNQVFPCCTELLVVPGDPGESREEVAGGQVGWGNGWGGGGPCGASVFPSPEAGPGQ